MAENDKKKGDTDDGIDYKAEGSSPDLGEEKRSETDKGYDEAAHSGPSKYAVPEGAGGVFSTSGGGTYDGGFQVEERPGVYDRSGEEVDATDRHGVSRTADRFDQVNFEKPDEK